MGEIKFRFWDTLVEKMFTMKEFSQTGMNLQVALEGTKIIKVMQYTGKHDEDGTEIWAGDFVEIDGGPSVIKSEPGGFTVAGLPLVEVSNYGMKVIGNIYENTELMEDK